MLLDYGVIPRCALPSLLRKRLEHVGYHLARQLADFLPLGQRSDKGVE